MTVGEKMRYYREVRGLTQMQLAASSGINVGTIRKYELGIRNPKPDQLIKIANGLMVNASIFYDLDISTVGDVMALLFMIEDTTKIDLTPSGVDENGNRIPAKISFENFELNAAIDEWHKAKTSIDNMKKSAQNQDDPRVKEYAERRTKELYEPIKLLLMGESLVLNSKYGGRTIKLRNKTEEERRAEKEKNP